MRALAAIRGFETSCPPPGNRKPMSRGSRLLLLPAARVFHVCEPGNAQHDFLCPEGTIFNQKYIVCDWWYNVDCPKSPDFFELNLEFFKEGEVTSPPLTAVPGPKGAVARLAARPQQGSRRPQRRRPQGQRRQQVAVTEVPLQAAGTMRTPQASVYVPPLPPTLQQVSIAAERQVSPAVTSVAGLSYEAPPRNAALSQALRIAEDSVAPEGGARAEAGRPAKVWRWRCAITSRATASGSLRAPPPPSPTPGRATLLQKLIDSPLPPPPHPSALYEPPPVVHTELIHNHVDQVPQEQNQNVQIHLHIHPGSLGAEVDAARAPAPDLQPAPPRPRLTFLATPNLSPRPCLPSPRDPPPRAHRARPRPSGRAPFANIFPTLSRTQARSPTPAPTPHARHGDGGPVRTGRGPLLPAPDPLPRGHTRPLYPVAAHHSVTPTYRATTLEYHPTTPKTRLPAAKYTSSAPFAIDPHRLQSYPKPLPYHSLTSPASPAPHPPLLHPHPTTPHPPHRPHPAHPASPPPPPSPAPELLFHALPPHPPHPSVAHLPSAASYPAPHPPPHPSAAPTRPSASPFRVPLPPAPSPLGHAPPLPEHPPPAAPLPRGPESTKPALTKEQATYYWQKYYQDLGKFFSYNPYSPGAQEPVRPLPKVSSASRPLHNGHGPQPPLQSLEGSAVVPEGVVAVSAPPSGVPPRAAGAPCAAHSRSGLSPFPPPH
ncbi:hypothetical protein C7M84_019398 [Penaeus vannamei]|uniref:Chitin-binding type-2 domain-containing protein n=1 Tax=Penaeus vannamei TaxID=6689 RepID=A0A423SET7_PENVA|nr:hypothetical protein C7M84_019398 [Penaeus vannamei]